MNSELTTIYNEPNIWEDAKKLQEIKSIFAPKLNTLEFQAFIGLGKATGLNPFLREIWAVKYADNAPAQIFIGRDGYRKSAQRNPNYDYHQADAVYSNDKFEVVDGTVKHSYKAANRGTLIGGYCIVQRRNSSRPMYVYVDLKEYDKNQSCWKTIKSTMITKVAEAQCIRMAFQEQFSGSYSEFEEHFIIEGDKTTKVSQSEKMNLLLAKKGLNHEKEINSIQDCTPNHIANHTDIAHGMHDSSSMDTLETNKTDAYAQMDGLGESQAGSSPAQDMASQCTAEQLDAIDCLMHEKKFGVARKNDALKHFDVLTFDAMTFVQAQELIAILNKIDVSE